MTLCAGNSLALDFDTVPRYALRSTRDKRSLFKIISQHRLPRVPTKRVYRGASGGEKALTRSSTTLSQSWARVMLPFLLNSGEGDGGLRAVVILNEVKDLTHLRDSPAWPQNDNNDDTSVAATDGLAH